MRVLAIDFETASSNPRSACSIGYGLLDEDGVIESDEILIKPHPNYSTFYYWNTKIHGLTADDVKDADDWPIVFGKIRDKFINSVVVAHNATFDIKVLKEMNALYGIQLEPFLYFDTVTLSRKVFSNLENHKLNTVCEYIGFDLNHHHAGSDALGCIAIVGSVMELISEYDIERFIERLKINIHVYNDEIID